MNALIPNILSIGVPTLAVLIGILVNNSRLSDTNNRISEVRAHLDQRINDLRDTLRAVMQRMEGIMDARLTRIEQELKLR